MANFHLNSKKYIDSLTFADNEVIVEIGSERGEGSTAWFDNIAKERNVDFYSIDVSTYAQQHLQYLQHTNFIVTNSGSTWAHNDLPKLDKKIKVLYLDNYDWLHTTSNHNDNEIAMIAAYRLRGVTMSNLNCQQEHLMQMIGCLPYMATNSIIICDDTPFQEHSGVYIGKNGAVVPYLLNYGYDVAFGRSPTTTCKEDNGIILVR
jgi:hypothetical protein